MAFVGTIFDKNPFLLKEGKVQAVTFGSPEAVITGGVDPFSVLGITVTGELGYIKMGTLHWDIVRKFATFKSSTPSQKVRIDLIEQEFTISGEMAQYDMDMLSGAMNLDLLDAGDFPTMRIGSDMPALADVGLLISTTLADDTPFYIGMFAGKMTSEKLGAAPSGTEHATYSLKGESTPHPNFTDSLSAAEAAICYGLIWQDRS